MTRSGSVGRRQLSPGLKSAVHLETAGATGVQATCRLSREEWTYAKTSIGLLPRPLYGETLLKIFYDIVDEVANEELFLYAS